MFEIVEGSTRPVPLCNEGEWGEFRKTKIFIRKEGQAGFFTSLSLREAFELHKALGEYLATRQNR
jgi:hypothetical protein